MSTQNSSSLLPSTSTLNSNEKFNNQNDNNQVRVYAHGVHDFIAQGHDINFMKAKYLLPNTYLIVGIISDVACESRSLEKLYNELERYESIAHCRHVDDVIQAPWKLTNEFIERNKIDYICHTDSEYKPTLFEYQHINKFPDKYLDLDKYDYEFENEDIRNDETKSSLDNNGQTEKPVDKKSIIKVPKLPPFSDDLDAIKLRNLCNYDFNSRITKDQANNCPRPIRIYSDGIYDMFHGGHARQLKQAKHAFKNVHLIVGVVNDELTKRFKGPTYVKDINRYEKVRHCKHVDEVKRDAPWVITEDFLTENKIDFVAHDDIPYTHDGHDDVYKHIKELGMFVTTKRMEGLSTTELKQRLKFDGNNNR